MIILAVLCLLNNNILSIQYDNVNAITEHTIATGAILVKKHVNKNVVSKYEYLLPKLNSVPLNILCAFSYVILQCLLINNFLKALAIYSNEKITIKLGITALSILNLVRVIPIEDNFL